MRSTSAECRAASGSGLTEIRTGQIGEAHPIHPVREGCSQYVP